MTFNLANDILWDYRINEDLKAAGTLGFANGRDAYFLNGAVLLGRTFGDHVWLQSEVVWQNTFFKDTKFHWGSTTLNVSGQYTLSSQDALDVTFGSILGSTLRTSPNLSIQMGYAHLFGPKK